MKKNILLLIVFVSFVLSTNQAKAALFFEPFAGMAFNSSGELSGTEVDISGSSLGLRLGFENMGLSLGLDGRKNTWKLDPSSGVNSNYTYTQLGFFVGYELPAMIRFWGNYVFNLEGVDDDDADTKFTEGSGMVFGVGFKTIPFISLNFEISNLSTKKLKSAVSEIDYDTDYTAYTLGVSFPFTL